MLYIATFISVNHMLHSHILLSEEVVSYKTQSIRNSDETELQKTLLMKIFVYWQCISRGSELVPVPTKRDRRNQHSMIQILRFAPGFPLFM